MITPFRIENPKALQAHRLSDDDIRDLSEIGRYLDSIETLSLRSSFSDMVHTLGRARDMVSRYRRVLNVLEQPLEEKEGQ